MHKKFDTPNRVLIVVENSVGLVSITAREGTATEVTLEADSAGAEELIAATSVESRRSGDRDTVRVKIPQRHGMKFVRRNAVTVRIEVPLGAAVDVTTASADVELNGTVGETRIKTASGDLNADDIDGDLTAVVASGNLSVGDVSGDLRMHSASSDLRADRVGGRASLSTASGDIEVGAVGDRADVRTTSGDVRLGHVAGDSSVVVVSGEVRVLSFASGELKVRSVSSDITIGIPPGTAFVVNAETMSGAVTSEIPVDGDSPPRGRPTEVRIVARSVSGDVTLERAVGALVP
jgi:DUF4097 and DUF4098 domain-containing protein YvlB